jgi:Rieske 2Fe-2S family protein
MTLPPQGMSDSMHTLSEIKKSLPASWYYDPQQYERELNAIWYRDWICVGRLESLARDGDYFVATIGNQKVVVTRVAGGRLNAFHNTCRHRGSELCRDTAGHFRNGRIICPYHTWTYSLEGELIATPRRLESDGFDLKNYPLYQVHVNTWGGFIFLNLSATPETGLKQYLGEEADNLRNWPLADMRSVRQEKLVLACNWKIFWENYCECYHCPRIHPELCKVMPVYKQGVFDAVDLPGWQPQFDGDTGAGRVGAGVRTWTRDGQTSLPVIDGPGEAEIAAGVVFASIEGSMYVVAHPDYVRSVRVAPTGPESIELVVDWLLPKGTETGEQDLERICDLARLVLEQDGDVCELNQRGLRSRSHEEGVLVAQEYELWRFHEHVRAKLAEPDAA